MSRIKKKHHTIAAVEAELLKRVRVHGRISRVELSRKLNIVPSTAGIYVDRLIRDGFLMESAQREQRSGRPPKLLELNPSAGRFVGVDFEARNLMATAVDFSERPLCHVHKTIRAADSVEQILEKIERTIAEVMAGDPRRVLGIGVGVPGAIDPHSGVALHYEFIKGWHNIPLGARLAKKFSVPVFLEGNIRCMALAELWFGAGRGLQDFVCIGIRSGIAAGVIVNGHLLRGSRNQAGEIGHWRCGDAQLEHVASLSAMIESAQRAVDRGEKTSLAEVKGELAIEDIVSAVQAGDPFALSLIEAAGRVHGWVVSELSALFDPQKIIFAGPLAELGEAFLAPVRESVTEKDVEITASTLGQYNGALGAAALALHQWKPKR
jgi:glucokinase